MNVYEVKIDPKAVEQTSDLHTFYESVSMGMGTDFLALLSDELLAIEANPGKWPFLRTRTEGIRKAIIRLSKRMQAIVLYEFDESVIYILEIHDSRSDWK